jgi:hypothetical protein
MQDITNLKLLIMVSRISGPALFFFLAIGLVAITAQDFCCRAGGCGPTGLEGPSPDNGICSWCCGGQLGGQGSPQPNSCLRYAVLSTMSCYL